MSRVGVPPGAAHPPRRVPLSPAPSRCFPGAPPPGGSVAAPAPPRQPRGHTVRTREFRGASGGNEDRVPWVFASLRHAVGTAGGLGEVNSASRGPAFPVPCRGAEPPPRGAVLLRAASDEAPLLSGTANRMGLIYFLRKKKIKKNNKRTQNQTHAKKPALEGRTHTCGLASPRDLLPILIAKVNVAA